MRINFAILLGITVKLLLFSPRIVGQTPANQAGDELTRLRLAQSFERAGDFEKASKAYEELYRLNSSNYLYFDGLQRSYMQLKKYDEAILLITDRLQNQLSDINLLGLLGEAYFKAGREREAYTTWERAFRLDEKNPNTYRFISNYMVQNRLFAQGIDVLQRGRKSLGDANVFASDLALLYAVVMKFDEATREYVRMLRENGSQLNFIEARMASYTSKSEGLNAAIRTVEEEINAEKNDLSLHRLLAWLFLEGKRFDKAFAVYRTIDELSRANGEEILAFAQRAFKEKAYSVAAQAYRELIDRNPKMPNLPPVKFGYARVLEELSSTSDSSKIQLVESPDQFPANESHPTYQGAIAYYSQIIKEYPQSDLASQALYRISVIKFDKFFDINGALRALEQIEKASPSAVVHPEIIIKSAEIYIAKGDLEHAAEKFHRVLGSSSNVQEFWASIPSGKDRALFALAEIDFFQGQFDSTLAKLKVFVKNISADYANDAISLQNFILENKATPNALREFARAEFLERQKKFTEAIAILQSIVNAFPLAPLVDDAMVKIGNLYRSSGKYDLAIATFFSLIEKYQDSILLDRAQFALGEVYQFNLKDRQKAIEAYEKLLVNYPNSLFVDEARKRIRQLRGDAI